MYSNQLRILLLVFLAITECSAQCNRTTNPFGECKCDLELWINDDCSQVWIRENDMRMFLNIELDTSFRSLRASCVTPLRWTALTAAWSSVPRVRLSTSTCRPASGAAARTTAGAPGPSRSAATATPPPPPCRRPTRTARRCAGAPRRGSRSGFSLYSRIIW